MTNDRATLQRLHEALNTEAADLERDPDKPPCLIEGVRYAAAFVGAQLATAVDIREATLRKAADRADDDMIVGSLGDWLREQLTT